VDESNFHASVFYLSKLPSSIHDRSVSRVTVVLDTDEYAIEENRRIRTSPVRMMGKGGKATLHADYIPAPALRDLPPPFIMSGEEEGSYTCEDTSAIYDALSSYNQEECPAVSSYHPPSTLPSDSPHSLPPWETPSGVDLSIFDAQHYNSTVMTAGNAVNELPNPSPSRSAPTAARGLVHAEINQHGLYTHPISTQNGPFKFSSPMTRFPPSPIPLVGPFVRPFPQVGAISQPRIASEYIVDRAYTPYGPLLPFAMNISAEQYCSRLTQLDDEQYWIGRPSEKLPPQYHSLYKASVVKPTLVKPSPQRSKEFHVTKQFILQQPPPPRDQGKITTYTTKINGPARQRFVVKKSAAETSQQGVHGPLNAQSPAIKLDVLPSLPPPKVLLSGHQYDQADMIYRRIASYLEEVDAVMFAKSNMTVYAVLVSRKRKASEQCPSLNTSLILRTISGGQASSKPTRTWSPYNGLARMVGATTAKITTIK
jgi:hypothetical protein